MVLAEGVTAPGVLGSLAPAVGAAGPCLQLPLAVPMAVPCALAVG